MNTTTIPRIQPVLFAGGKGQPYSTPLGELPSVTTILRATQPEETRKKLEQWRKANPKNNAAERGTLVHKAIEDLLTGKPASLPESLVGFYHSIAPFLATIQPLLIEGGVYHPHGYAGRLDALAIDADGQVKLIDWKTSNKPFLYTSLQEYDAEIQNWEEQINQLWQKVSEGTLSQSAANRSASTIRKRHLSRVTADKEKFEDYCCQVAAYARAANHTYADQLNEAITNAVIAVAIDGEPCQVIELNEDDLDYFWDIFEARLDRFYLER
jgi:hypothetical protein